MYLQYGIVKSYTIEANYSKCNRLNKEIFPEASATAATTKKLLDGVKKPRSKVMAGLFKLMEEYEFDTISASYFFTQTDFIEMGNDVAKTFLDHFDINPISRIPSTPFRNIRNLKLYLAFLLAGELPYKKNLYLRCLLCKVKDNLTECTSPNRLIARAGVAVCEICGERDNRTQGYSLAEKEDWPPSKEHETCEKA